jgi:hypothetical protein
MRDDLGDEIPEPPSQIAVGAVDEGEIEGGQLGAQRLVQTTRAREKSRAVGALVGEQAIDVGGAGSHERAAGARRGQQRDSRAGTPQRRERPAQQQQIAQRAGPDDQDPQGTSMRAVATLPSRSVARTITMWGPGGARRGWNS